MTEDIFDKLISLIKLDSYKLVVEKEIMNGGLWGMKHENMNGYKKMSLQKDDSQSADLLNKYFMEKSLTYETRTDLKYNAIHLLRSHHFFFYEILLEVITTANIDLLMKEILITQTIFNIQEFSFVELGIFNLKDRIKSRKYIRITKGYCGWYELALGLSSGNNKIDFASEEIHKFSINLPDNLKQMYLRKRSRSHRWVVSTIKEIIFVPVHSKVNLGHCLWNTIGAIIKYKKFNVYEKLIANQIEPKILKVKGDYLDVTGFFQYIIGKPLQSRDEIEGNMLPSTINKSEPKEIDKLLMPLDTNHRYSEYFKWYPDFLRSINPKDKLSPGSSNIKVPAIILTIKGSGKHMPMLLQVSLISAIIKFISKRIYWDLEFKIDGVTRDLTFCGSNAYKAFLDNELYMYELITKSINDKKVKIFDCIGLDVHRKHSFYLNSKVAFGIGGSSAITHSYSYDIPILKVWYKNYPPSRLARTWKCWGDELTPINRKYIDEYSLWSEDTGSNEFMTLVRQIGLAIIDYIFEPSPSSVLYKERIIS